MTDAALIAALEESQRLGMLGARPISEVIDHASAFVAALGAVGGTVIDLGSGGGVPGLVIAQERPDLHLVLVERRTARADHLRRLVHRLGLVSRVDVSAIDAARLPSTLPAPVAAVVARGFGPPDVTLRRAAPLLAAGGLVVISEPPDPSVDRWPVELLAELGLVQQAGADRRVACFVDVSRGTEG